MKRQLLLAKVSQQELRATLCDIFLLHFLIPALKAPDHYGVVDSLELNDISRGNLSSVAVLLYDAGRGVVGGSHEGLPDHILVRYVKRDRDMELMI